MTSDELDRAINLVLQHSAELDAKLQQVASAMVRLTEIAEIESRRLARPDTTQALYDAMLARDEEVRARQEERLAAHDQDLARHNEMIAEMIAQILRRQEETQAGIKRILDRLTGSP